MNLSPFFQDQVVVVTGSSRGIGREVARQALEAGARVVLNGRDGASLEATRTALGHSERTMAVVGDLSRPEEAEYLVATTVAAWGRIDVLINNAGLSMRGTFSELTPGTVRSMVEANFLTAVWTTLAALPALRSNAGRVVFVSSLAGLRGFPGVSLYSASKMALTALHQSLAAEERRQGVSFSLVYLAFTENDPGKTVLASDGTPFQHDRPWAISQTKAATSILLAAAERKKRVILTVQGRMLAWAQALFPALIDWIVAGSKGKIHSVRRPGS
jgi:short-subunit dehydrogenase